MGRSRRSVTHRYDAEGNEVGRVVTVHEPEFTDEDTQLALERRAAKDAECSGCGLPRDEVWLPDLDGLDEIEQEAVLAEARAKHGRWELRQRLCAACEKLGEHDRQAGSHPVLIDRGERHDR